MKPVKKPLFLPLFLLFFAIVPVILAWNQDVPTRSAYQGVVLSVSLGAFGVLLGQFWLSRMLPRNTSGMRFSGLLRWHKIIGYTAGTIMLLHPVLIISRRFWVQESDPIGNLLLMVRSPAMLPAVIAWILLALIALLALVRRTMPYKSWRILHGLLSSCFAGFAAWHVVATGRHSNATLSAIWIVLAAGASAALLLSYLPAHSTTPIRVDGEVAHDTAR